MSDGADLAPIDRSERPAPGPSRHFRFPEYDRSQVLGGLDVLTARRRTSPVFYAELVLPAGAENEPIDRPGLCTLTTALMDEGTPTRSSTEIAEEVENRGGFLTTSAGWNAAYLAFGGLDSQLSSLFEVATDVVATPVFAVDEIERLKSERAAEIARRSTDPAAVAARAVGQVLYRGGTYSEPLIGTEEALREIDRAQIVGFHRERITRGGSSLIVVGDVEHGAIVDTAERLMTDWHGTEPSRAEHTEPDPLRGIEVHLYDRPDAAQTELRLAHHGVPRAHPDYETLVVLNSVLGGKFTSRLNLNLREKRGLTYGVHSRFARRRGRGPFTVETAVSTEHTGTAVREAIGEIDRLRGELVGKAELDDTRNYIVGVFPYTLQTNEGLAQRLVDITVHDLPADYFDRYVERISAVGSEAVLSAAQRHLDPGNMAIIAVGPVAELHDQLEDLGPVTIHDPASS